jgi:PelA/Pel-15E family pectate lyase
MRSIIGIIIMTITLLTTAHAASLADRAVGAIDRGALYYLDSAVIHDAYTVLIRDGKRGTMVSIDHATPKIGLTWMRLYRLTGQRRYLEAAKQVGVGLARLQLASGGWQNEPQLRKRNYFTLREKKAGIPRHGRIMYGSYDDNTTQGATAFFMELDEATGPDSPFRETLTAALDFMLKSQYPNGGWTQFWPDAHGYHRWFTFNDDAIRDCIMTMLKAYHLYGEQKYLDAALRGGDFIIASQLPEPQPGWAQQVDYDLKPTWAREFEPPGVCARVTASNIRTLTDLYLESGDKRFLAPVPAAAAWLERSRLDEKTFRDAGLTLLQEMGRGEPGQWSRLYELGTNRPIFGDRGQPLKYYYDVREISEERQTGYSWVSRGCEADIIYYRDVVKTGRDAFLARRAITRATPSPTNVEKIITTQDSFGRWLRDGSLHSGTFTSRVNTLAAYLAARNQRPLAPASPRILFISTNPAEITTTTDSVTVTATLKDVAPGTRVSVSIAALAANTYPMVEPKDAVIPMRDDGTNGDETAGDGRYTAIFTRPISPHAEFRRLPGMDMITVMAIDPDHAWDLTTHEIEVRPGEKTTASNSAVNFDGNKLVLTKPVKGGPTEWQIVGPYPHAFGTLNTVVYPPEKSVDTRTSYPAYPGLEKSAKKLRWRSVEPRPNMYVDLKHHVSLQDTVLAYAAAWLKVDVPTKARILFGCNDVATVYLNGTKVFTDTTAGGAILDNDTIPVMLPAGESTILVKCGDGGGRQWGFFLRIVDENGKPLTHIWRKQ